MIRLAESQYLHQMGVVDLYRFLRTLWHWSRLTVKPPTFPEFLWIETTNACNLRCKMCPVSLGRGRPTGRMDPALYARLLDQVRGRVYGIFLFFGGDPLCDTAYGERIREARALDLRVFVHTNAALLDAERTAELLDAEPTTVSFSLDTADATRYEEWRVGARHAAVLENIRCFLRAARTRPRRPLTLIQLIDVDGSGPRDAAALRERLGPDQPDEYRIRPLHDWAGELSEQVGTTVESSHPYYPCIHLWKAMVIAWDGAVISCCNDLEGQLRLGDAAAEPLAAIWNGPAMVSLRARLIAGRHLPRLCTRCVNLHHPLSSRWFFRAARFVLGGTRRLAAARRTGDGT